MCSRALQTSILVAFLATASVAAAGDPSPDSQAADALFNNAKAAMDRGDLSTACAEFGESQRLDPAAGTLLNLAECEERIGRLAGALGHFQEGRAALPASDYRIPFADTKIAGLARSVPKLTIRVVGAPVPGARVRRDDVEVAPASLGVALPIDPGAHVFVVTAPGREDARVALTLRMGEERTLDLPLGAPTSPATPVAPAVASAPVHQEPAPDHDSRGKTQRAAAYVTAGAGVVSLAVGSVLGLVAKQTYDAATVHCAGGPSSCNGTGYEGGQTAHNQAAAATGAFIAGGALIAGGAALFFTAPKRRAVATPGWSGHVAVAPTAGPSAAGVMLEGEW